VAGDDAALTADIEAAALVPAPPEDVFEFLSDLGNHWLLTDRYVHVVSLDGSAGGVVRIRGPLGWPRRSARTHVKAMRAPRLIIGVAELGDGTRARVSWTLATRGDRTRVRLAAEIERAAPVDRLLLALGGRHYMQRAFADALAQLAERFA